MATKTAIGTPEEGPKKKGYGIPDKDKKGLKSKTYYKSINERPSDGKDYNRRHPESMKHERKEKPKVKPHEQFPDTPKVPKGPKDRDYNRHPESMKHERKEKTTENPHARLKNELNKKSRSVKIVQNVIKKREDK